jgi:hypothetical protein
MIGYGRPIPVGQTLGGAQRVIERGRMLACEKGEQREKRSLPDRLVDPIFIDQGKGDS